MKRLPTPVRKALPITLVALTIVLFVYLFTKHPEYRHTLASTNPLVLVLIAVLYGVLLLCLNWMYATTLELCGKRLSRRDNLLLTGYATIVNFFGPGQSGPGVRAAYVKQKLGVKYRDYTLATFVYYAMYATTSALFLLIGSGRHWPIALAIVVAVASGSAAILYTVRKRVIKPGSSSDFSPKPAVIGKLALAVLCQLSITTVIYLIELRAVHTGANIWQATVYAGAANLAVFVSLTPGAIGFREAFLEFSRQLHHIPTSGILAASVIDRSVYVVFLGLLFLFTLSMHVGDRFKKATESAEIDTTKP